MPAERPTAIAVVFDGSPAIDDIADLQAGMRHLSGVGAAWHAEEQLTLFLSPQL